MPFCTNCGTTVNGNASFCSHCGSAQARQQAPHTDFLGSLSDRTACILCYVPVLGVIPAIVFLASSRFRLHSRVRFDAFQALYLFVAWLIVSSAMPTLFFGGMGEWGAERSLISLLKLGLFICWVYLLVKAAQEQQVRLPIIGDLAARSSNEQL